MTKNSKIKAHTVITAHANADFDALASMVAASKLYPDAVLVFPGSQEKNLRNFFIESTTYLFNFKAFKDIDPKSVELLVVVDTRQRSRIPHVRPVLDNPDLRIHLMIIIPIRMMILSLKRVSSRIGVLLQLFLYLRFVPEISPCPLKRPLFSVLEYMRIPGHSVSTQRLLMILRRQAGSRARGWTLKSYPTCCLVNCLQSR